ncbi:MAG: bifunctional YncE family protein/alkaline phosphatase family protein [Acidobacteria bacterium]|nr:bifunctional YncE family protein/alkaline phosphatase family protein [Acidobacteriota bacterium]
MLKFLQKRPLFLVLMLVLASAATAAMVVRVRGLRVRSNARAGKQADGTTLVVTQQILKPWTPERYLAGRPVDMAFNHDRSQLAILNGGNIDLIDEKTGKQTSIPTSKTSYCGIAFRPGADEVWASEANRNGAASIMVAQLNATRKSGRKRIEFPKKSLPAGIAFSADGKTAYIALNGANTIAVLDAETHAIKQQIPVDLAPLFVKLSNDEKTLYVSNRGGHVPEKGARIAYSAGTAMATDEHGAVLNGTVSVIDLASGKVKSLTVERAPTSLALSPDGKTLAVTNSYSDSVSLIDTATLKIKTIAVPTMPDHLLGTVPSAVVFSPDGRWLYVAAALNNAVIVMERKGSTYQVAGAVPTGWFPGALAFDSHNSLVVLNIKGRGNTVATKTTTAPADAGVANAHNTHSFEGSLMRVPVLTPEQLKVATQFVVDANNPHFEADGGVKDLATLGIKHVILIVKENRTYDQVLGDIGKGNSDPEYALYGEQVTPNIHALARKYVLLDNFYATGAISFDGHQWLEQGFVGDNMERSTNGPRGYAWNMADALDVSPGGFFWQHPQRPLDVRVGGVLSNGVTLVKAKRDDDEVQGDIDQVKSTAYFENLKLYKENKWRGRYGVKAAVPSLQNIIDSNYPGGAGIPDQMRASILEDEIAEAEKTGHLPDLMVYSLPCDHTMGTRPGAPAPKSMVADNDYALGRIVSAVSHSKFWPETLILVVEDDAQNGTDHVDGHRTVALAIGPMVKRGAVDSNFYTQLSMTRTIQDILHVDPQTHFLKASRTMNSIFTGEKDLSAYTPIAPKISLEMVNPPANALTGQAKKDAIASSKMNWSDLDDAPEQVLNRILWATEKGYNIPMPAARKSIPADVH